jgi:hypothetical protein
MAAPAYPRSAEHSLTELHARFLVLLPRIELHGRIFFRDLACHKREEAIAEMVALAWKWFCRLAERGKDVSQFQMDFVYLVARAVKSGRRVASQAKAKDVMNPATQRRHGFNVERLHSSTCASHKDLYSTPHGQELHDAFEERLRDNTMTPVPEQVAFRIDWPAWVITRTDRDRRIIKDLIAGERTLDVSRRHGISAARVSQLRREFHDDWLRFNGEASEEQVAYAA